MIPIFPASDSGLPRLNSLVWRIKGVYFCLQGQSSFWKAGSFLTVAKAVNNRIKKISFFNSFLIRGLSYNNFTLVKYFSKGTLGRCDGWVWDKPWLVSVKVVPWGNHDFLGRRPFVKKVDIQLSEGQILGFFIPKHMSLGVHMTNAAALLPTLTRRV